MRCLTSTAFAIALSSLMIPLAPRADVTNRATAREWSEQLRAVDRELRQQRWETALRLAQALAEQIADGVGGTFGDHRDKADASRTPEGRLEPPPDATVLARACALRAVAEVGVGRTTEARWSWYVAQNLSPDARSLDLSGFGEPGRFLMSERLPDAGSRRGLVDVRDPVRPEPQARGAFREPERLTGPYPTRPEDLKARDRFSHVVFVEITVMEDGEPTHPIVVDGGYYPGLIYRAFEALRQWRYRPATSDGRAIPFRFIVPVPFADDRPAPPGAPRDAPAVLDRVSGMTVDARTGYLYVADAAANTVYRLDPGDAVILFAGIGVAGFGGDGGAAARAQFDAPAALSIDPRTGDLFVADTGNYRIRRISAADRVVDTVAGIGIRGVPARLIPYHRHTPESIDVGHFAGDGGPAVDAELNMPSGVCADAAGILFIADSGNHRVRAVNRGSSPVTVMGVEIEPGAIRTIAGTGALGFAGDGGRAARASLAFPTELRVDTPGNLFLVDSFNQRVRRIDRQSGVIDTVATGSLPDVSPRRALHSWSTSIAGLGITPVEEVLYTDRVLGAVHRVSRNGNDAVVFRAAKGTELGRIEAGPDGDFFVTDVSANRVIRVRRGAPRTYLKGRAAPATADFAMNNSSGR